jgi:hypothetical protein
MLLADSKESLIRSDLRKESTVAQQFDEISDRHEEFIAAQHVFFVATAARDGRVNVSPKGLDSLRVLGPNRVVWLNGTGSGNETAAHLRDINRMTIMFCSFERKPLILRLYGTATEVQPDQPEWDELAGLFQPMLGARQAYDMQVGLVQTSCGYGVPFLEFVDDRPLMAQWADKKGPDGLEAYHRDKNLVSIDGFPTGLRVP